MRRYGPVTLYPLGANPKGLDTDRSQIIVAGCKRQQPKRSRAAYLKLPDRDAPTAEWETFLSMIRPVASTVDFAEKYLRRTEEVLRSRGVDPSRIKNRRGW